MDATRTSSLADFGPHSIWLASVGCPTGVEVTISGTATDDMGNSWEIEDDWSGVPDNFAELVGTVNEKGTEWRWDGVGEPRDWNRNTVLQVVAIKS